MKSVYQWTPWILLMAIIGGIAVGFYLAYFELAFACMGLLIAVIGVWGRMAQIKNTVNHHLDIHRTNAAPDIEKYTR